jgi:hypothetical protein
VVGNVSRAAIISDRRITGLSADVIAELVAELGPLWHERHQARLASRPRKRAVGAGAKHRLVFIDRLLATLVHLRHATTHDVLACWFGVDRSTITRAIAEVRPLLAERGCTISPGVRLRTLAEVIDHLGADGKTGIIDDTEIRVRWPAAGRKDRDRFISGKNKQNAVKTMVVTDERLADHDDQAGVGVDDDLVVGGVPVVLRPLGDGVIPGGDQGAVHDEHGVLGEPLAGFEGEYRPEMVDDAVRRRLGHSERRGELAHGEVRAPVRRDQQCPVLRREAPWPALADRVRALAPQKRHQLPESAWAEPGERGYPGRLRRRDHTSHNQIISAVLSSDPKRRAAVEGTDRDGRSTHGSSCAGDMGRADRAPTRAVAPARAVAPLHLLSSERGLVAAGHACRARRGLYSQMAMDQVGR